MSSRVRNSGLVLVLVAFAAQGQAKSKGATVAAAAELLEAWQLEDAKDLAEQFLVEDPTNPEVWYLAAQVQHARGEHLSALSLLRAASAAGVVDHADISPLVESSARYAAHFQTFETDHFKIRYLNKDEIVATYAAPVLEAAYQGIGTALDLLPAERREKIVVEIYPDARGLAGATGLTIGEIEASGTIAVCKFHRLMITSPLATAAGYAWANTIAHELVHLVISKKSKNTIPIWLHEGIAKYFESTWRGAPGKALSPYAEKLLAAALRKKKLITYRQMHPSMAKLPTQDDAALAFAEVFTTLEYLVGEHGVSSVSKLLALAAAGTPIEQALRRIYGMGLEDIETSWKQYLTRRPFREAPGAKPRPIRLVAHEDTAYTLHPLEEMHDREAHDASRLGELLQLRGHTKAAVVEYEKAYAKSGVTYASLVYRLARAYLDTNRREDARRVLEKAERTHPDETDLQLLAGRAFLADGDLTRARRQLLEVRLHNPFNPEVHEALRKIYESQGDKEQAALEAHFLQLASKPRPTRDYALPPPRPGTGRLSIITVPFGDITLDGEKIAAPVWQLPMTPGVHRLEVKAQSGQVSQRTITLVNNEQRTVVLR